MPQMQGILNGPVAEVLSEEATTLSLGVRARMGQ